MQVAVGVELPQVGPVPGGQEVAQDQVDGVLLLRVRVAVGHEALEAGQLVLQPAEGLPVAALLVKLPRVRAGPSVLQQPSSLSLQQLQAAHASNLGPPLPV